MPEFLNKNGQDIYIESVGVVSRSCPFTFEEIVVDKETTYTASVCIKVTNLILNVSPQYFYITDLGISCCAYRFLFL